MKYLFVLSFIFSFNLWACPKLTGKYASCINTTFNNPVAYDLEVDQKVINRTNVFTLTSTDPLTKERETEVLHANGEIILNTETDPETGASVTLSTKVICEGRELKTEMTLTYDGEIYSKIQTSTSKYGKQLIQKISGVNLGREENYQEIVCE